MRQAAKSAFQVVIIQFFEFRDGVVGKKIRCYTASGYLPRRRLAPFSQNSKTRGSAGLAQAQLTHINPSGLFCFNSTREPLKGT